MDSSWQLSLFTLMIGLVLGSFLTVLIPRLHEGTPGILLGRSKCPSCDQVLSPLDLVPVLSFMFRLGRCKHCKNRISIWYPLIELTMGLASLVSYLFLNDFILWIAYLPVFMTLIFIFFYDLRYQEIHDLILIPAILYTLALSIFLKEAPDVLLGSAIGFLFFGLQYALSKGRWIGSGDLRIGVLIGAFLGWKLTLVALVLSYLLGSLISIFLLISGHLTRKSTIPLGPFLVLGSILAYFYGAEILKVYGEFIMKFL